MPIYKAPKDYLSLNNASYGSVYTSAKLTRWQQERLVRNTLEYKYSRGASKFHFAYGSVTCIGALAAWGAIEATFAAFDAYTGAGRGGFTMLAMLLTAILILITCVVAIYDQYPLKIVREARVRFAKDNTGTVVAVDIDNDERWKLLETAWEHFVNQDGTLHGVHIPKDKTLEHTLRLNDGFCSMVESTIDHYFKSSNAMYDKIIEMRDLNMTTTDPFEKLRWALAAMTEKTVADMITIANTQQQEVDQRKAVAIKSYEEEVEGLTSQANFFLKQDPIIP